MKSGYKFGQKKVLEEAYGGNVLPFSKALTTYKDVSSITKKGNMNPYLITKGSHPSVTKKEPEEKKRGRKKKVVDEEPLVIESPKPSPKKRGRKKKVVEEDEPIVEDAPKASPKKKIIEEDEPLIEDTKEDEPMEEPPKKRGRKKKIIQEDEAVPSVKSPKKGILIKEKRPSTKKVRIQEEGELSSTPVISPKTTVNYPKDPFLLPKRLTLSKVSFISFPTTDTLLYPTKKVILIQDYGMKDNVGLEKKKEETKALLSILEKIDYRKLEGYREGNRKIKYLKPELVKIAKELYLPIKTGDKRDAIANEIKKKYDASGYSKKK